MNIYDLISRAQKLRKETQLDSVSPDRVGGLHEDTLKYINEFQLLASSPSLHKIYASVSAMQSDKSPKSDLTGNPLKPGQLVVIVPANQTDATAGDVYRYDGPSGNTSAWTFVAKIGAVPADAELSATSTNPPQNKVVTEKLTELESESVNQHVDLETTSGYYINISGIKTSTAYPFAYTKPIKVNNGDVVKVKCAAPTSVSVISLTDENNTTSDPVVFGKGGDLETYEYRSEQETYIVLSFETRLPFSCVICKERFSSLGWTERTDIPLGSFLDDNTSFFNYKTKEYVAGNGIFYSKRIDVDAYKAIEIQSEIISSTSKMALVNFFDANDNLISFHNRYIQETLISSIIDIPTGAEYVVINYLKSRRSALKIAGLAGTRTDDVLRQKDAESIKAESIAKSRENVLLEDFGNRIYLPLLIENREYYNYADGNYVAGNGSWFSMVVELGTMEKLHYTIPTYKLTSAAIAFLNFVDNSNNLLSYVGRFDALYDEKELTIDIPTGAARCIVNFPTNAIKQNISLSFVEQKKDNAARVYATPMWREKYFNDNAKILDKWYNYNTQSYEAGNGVWKSLEIDARGCMAIKTYHQLTSSANKATLTFLDANGNYIGNALPYSVKESEPYMRMVWLPKNVSKIIITTLTYNPHDISRFWVGYVKSDKHYETMRDMVGNAAKGLCRVGKSALFVNNTSTIQDISETQPAISIPYYDANESQGQYERIGLQNKIHNESLNNAGGYEISFIPENDGYTRSIIGKDENDVFFIAYTNSNRKGKIANSINNKLEITTDFVEFKTIWVSDGMTSAMSIANIANLYVKQVRQMADGSYLIFSAYNKVAENKAYVGYFRMSRDMQQIEQVMCTDINGDYVEMNGTGTLLNDGDNHLSDCYDWHINISGKKVICSEYGDRNDLGRVFYSEDCGRTFKEIFRLKNHLQDGIENEVVTQAHVHGVMIDDFDGRLFVIGGENNSNIFYSDKGINTTDDSWTCIVIRNQLPLRHIRYTQVVNGMPFENCILFGSDNEGFGGLYRLNKLEDKKYSDLEIGFECKPYVMFTTSYCAASMQKKNGNVPALMCFTRENHGLTTEQNEELNQSHYGRVVASIDGYQFAEVWRDNTYGVHEIYNESTGELENRNISYCTREMNAYVCKNGDVYIKYAGRDFVYLGYEGYVKGYGDFSARVYKIPNGAKLISL